jgi:hypothetical protein
VVVSRSRLALQLLQAAVRDVGEKYRPRSTSNEKKTRNKPRVE